MKKLLATCALCLSLTINVFANGVADESLAIAMNQQNWEMYDTDYKKDLLYVLMYKCAENLDIDVPNLEFFSEDALSDGHYTAGYYLAGDNTVHINETLLDSSKECIKDIAHEIRHAWQWKCARNPVNDIACAMLYNFANYIPYTPEDPYAYKYQFVEIDARSYADIVSAEFAQIEASLQ